MPTLETRLTQKGQVTIPAEIRARLGLKPRDSVRFEIEGDKVVLKPIHSKVLAGYGAVKPRKVPEDWATIREKTERVLAEEVAAEDQ